MLLQILLRMIIKTGALRLIDEKGNSHVFGEGAPDCTLRVARKGAGNHIARNPRLRFFEAIMEGDLVLEQGNLRQLMELLAKNYNNLDRHPALLALRRITRQTNRLSQYNPIGKAQKNVAHHYDLSRQLYDLFLDADRQYSCAYFVSPDDSLETAQENKKCHLASKLYLERPNLKVLDIGSGWGGLGLYLAQIADCDVTGVTLSQEQHALSEERAKEAKLEDRCRFYLRDYREDDGHYDRIVSVGMFEHVGKKNYDEFFFKIRDLLKDDGVCVLHSISRFDEPSAVIPFIRKYIFPGGDIPALSEVTASIERSGLYITDIEVLRLHYAETLRNWHERFLANRERIEEIYDERFCRMWELYLLASEMGFRYTNLMVFQIQLTKKLETLPLTRDYMTQWEQAHSNRPDESTMRDSARKMEAAQ